MYDVLVVGWHLVAQILYTVGVMLVLVALIFSQLQFCCGRERACAFRTLGGALLLSCKTTDLHTHIYSRCRTSCSRRIKSCGH